MQDCLCKTIYARFYMQDYICKLFMQSEGVGVKSGIRDRILAVRSGNPHSGAGVTL